MKKMVDSTQDLSIIEREQQERVQKREREQARAHAEELMGALRDIRGAAADACKRRELWGRPGGTLVTVIDAYLFTRTWYGAWRYQPLQRPCTIWHAGYLSGNVSIGLDDELYLEKRPSDESKRKGQISGSHKLTDEAIIELIGSRDLRYVELFTKSVDKLWAGELPQASFSQEAAQSGRSGSPRGGTTDD